MPAPYRTDEIATALMAVARRADLPLHSVEISANDAARIWVIRLRGRDGEEHRLNFPFASARGIYTPAEIADHITRGTWPFG